MAAGRWRVRVSLCVCMVCIAACWSHRQQHSICSRAWMWNLLTCMIAGDSPAQNRLSHSCTAAASAFAVPAIPAKKSNTQALADAIASWFVPVVSLIAAATFATWLGLGLSGKLNPELLPAGTTPLLLALLSAGGHFSAVLLLALLFPAQFGVLLYLPCCVDHSRAGWHAGKTC